jgi:alpha-galactosidase
VSGDIFPGWDNVVRIVNINSFKMHYTNFWGHNDADMLEIGNGLNPSESRSHFALWAAMKSPLLIGTDLSKLSKDDLAILTNRFLLDFNQDEVYGAPAMPYKWGANPDWTFNASWPAQYWSGQSQAGTLVLLFNPGETEMKMVAKTSEIPGLSDKSYRAIDVWTGDELPCARGWNTIVQPHDTFPLLVYGECK